MIEKEIEKNSKSPKPEEKSEDLKAPEKPEKKKKARQQVHKGQAHIQCTYNNTLVSITDLGGSLLGWSSAGLLGFKGAKKATSYAATQVVADVYEKIKKYGVAEVEVYVKGVGGGRESSIRALANKGLEIISIKDVTPIPHNGCRPKKPRRV